MARLIYVNNVSLDGRIEDQHGSFNLYPHDDEVFAAYTDLVGSVGTFLYGRRLYETMALWETEPALAAQSDATAEFAAAWQAADKVVYSTTLRDPTTRKTRIEHRLDAASVRTIKASTDGDMTIGGAQLASQAFAMGLVDECRLFVWPAILGGGKPALTVNTRADLRLLDERRFANGVLLLSYALEGSRAGRQD